MKLETAITDKIKTICDELVETGFSYQPQCFSKDFCQDVQNAFQQMTFTDAQIGRGSAKLANQEIRKDKITWLDENSPKPLQEYMSEMNLFKSRLNQELYLGINSFEAHLAIYQPGGFYKKHLDQHSGSKDRILSTILYVNSAPTVKSGGEIRLFKKDDPEKIERDILPLQGSFLCFLSDQIYHEVLTSHFERHTIAGWMRSNQNI